MKITHSHNATIWVGLRETDTGIVHQTNELIDVCQRYCDDVGLCVSVTETVFVYTNGKEKGAAIGLINYPRFPSTRRKIKSHALTIARILLEAMKQYKITITVGRETIMIERTDA